MTLADDSPLPAAAAAAIVSSRIYRSGEHCRAPTRSRFATALMARRIEQGAACTCNQPLARSRSRSQPEIAAVLLSADRIGRRDCSVLHRVQFRCITQMHTATRTGEARPGITGAGGREEG
jgi:hypothetical protein